MKRHLGIVIVSGILWIGTSAFAAYEDFSNQLETMGLDVNAIESQDSISRYDLARLLNIVECKDCINPNQDMLNKYVQNFWSTFTVGKDFADISFLGGLYNNSSYYYCVAYVGDNTYMRGYPKATSPVCGGQFCGTKKTTTAEFIQVVINILAKYIYKDISLNRKNVNTRIGKLKTDSYEAKNFTTDDKQVITEKSKSCDNICALQNSNEVNLYLKYCMFNIAKCNMKKVGKIKQGYRPVAELNLLYNQSIIDIDQTQRRNTDKNIDGKTVLETLFKLNGKVNCAFNNDYDYDGLDNAKDSCPNAYNPKQKDTDSDGIGDPCDDDIDGDGVKNPIGIVDDEGRIDIAKRTKDTDNCLFIVNTNQQDSNQNNIGDLCENMGNNDYDCDGLDNAKDSCPNAYNPKQKDTDSDGIGDPCDDDIDGDGVKNPIGIVDDEGRIDIAKRTKDTDNCLFIVNTNQQDSSQNSIGDLCENMGNQIGIYIGIDKLEGSAPLTTAFTAVTKGNVNEIDRDFGDGTQGKGTSITHTFLAPGMYNVQATAKGSAADARAQVIVIVGGQIGDDKAFQTRASVVGGPSNTESMLSASLLGSFDDIERIFQKENISSKKTINESFKRIFKESGENPVLVKGYSNGELAGISYFTIGIDGGRGAILKSNTANPEINEKVLFDTKTYNIQQADIVTVNRDFGDGTKKSNTTLTLEYAFTQPGKRVITQVITTIDGKKLTSIITMNIVDKSLLASYALMMTPSTLIANIGQKINFSARIIGSPIKTPIIQIVEFADGVTQQKPGTEKMPSLFIHSYQKNGSLTPQDSMYIDQCTYLRNQATISIKGTDSCLDAKIAGTLKEEYKCDLDGDGIPDICDTDIDDDGVPNLLGLINFENKNCAYESDPATANANLNQEILTAHYQSVCSLDNAPFNNNPDQLDLDQNGIGDIQDTTPVLGSGETVDTDGDGIPDTQDLCPTIQETRNGVTDEDGCPEVDQELGCNQIISLVGVTNDTLVVKPTQCNQCPCQFADFASDLTNNDQVRAVLRDKKKTIQYKFSLPWIIDF